MTFASSVRIARHAAIRANQRGIRNGVIQTIVEYGKDIGRNRYDLDPAEAFGRVAELKAEQSAILRGPWTRRKAEQMRELRQTIRSIERALNMVVVICGASIVTTYHGRRRRHHKPLAYLS
ncbi:hypothetical protein [Mesorhizobium sp. WSM3860]|uniref:hypothetical protein n=1 Tax=Mesorhizobium sp. WSM3860 TaxID=2029403 RepID=UPI000BAF6404|nr:hypothetical protein [Mesorhizobium sp. WSM3860]PBC01464.1 hypothetical protein CK220_26010 [Mesorhizobium sp. WSM3860]